MLRTTIALAAGLAIAALAPPAGAARLDVASCTHQGAAVFYAPTDWARLAQSVAALPCADAYVSIPPLAGDKTIIRAGEAPGIRASGPHSHAMAEINYAAWTAWVASHATTFTAAGIEARARMVAAGFDVTAGDIWALNEIPTDVWADAPGARAQLLAFLDGLADGGGTLPLVPGLVFNHFISQCGLAAPAPGCSDPGLTAPKAALESWLSDGAFWQAAGPDIRFFADEVFADTRGWGVAGTTRDDRADHLTAYLEHLLVLAHAAPAGSIEPALDVLDGLYVPLASAAWSRPSGFGYTAVPIDQMERFVSEETYAVRRYAASRPSAQAADQVGFAWAPLNPGLDPATFAAQTQALLTRLAQAIAQSQQTDIDPVQACVDPGRRIPAWCREPAVPGAAFSDAWSTFGVWP